MSKNKRDKGERIAVELLVDYNSGGNYLFDFCKDLGAGGIFIATDSPKDTGETINLTFTIPDSKETLTIDGIVMWSQKPGPGEAKPGMGIQFSEYDSKSRKSLEDFVNRYSAS